MILLLVQDLQSVIKKCPKCHFNFSCIRTVCLAIRTEISLLIAVTAYKTKKRASKAPPSSLLPQRYAQSSVRKMTKSDEIGGDACNLSPDTAGQCHF